MNVKEMTPEEKSAALMKLAGIEHNARYVVVDCEGQEAAIVPTNLYDPANMALLARVIEWACEQDEIGYAQVPEWTWNDYFEVEFDPSAFHKSMCAMADEILKAALEAGMVE